MRERRGSLPSIAASPAAPSIVWVGEPTLWGVTSAHKGIRDYEVTITGKLARGAFSAAFLLACLAVLELEGLSLGDL